MRRSRRGSPRSSATGSSATGSRRGSCSAGRRACSTGRRGSRRQRTQRTRRFRSSRSFRPGGSWRSRTRTWQRQRVISPRRPRVSSSGAERAIELAEKLGEDGDRRQRLDRDRRRRGDARERAAGALEKALALARTHGTDEQIARAYSALVFHVCPQQELARRRPLARGGARALGGTRPRRPPDLPPRLARRRRARPRPLGRGCRRRAHRPRPSACRPPPAVGAARPRLTAGSARRSRGLGGSSTR